MTVLGISAYYHDSSAALIVDGQIVAGALEERFSRKKHDNTFPVKAIQFCLGYANISLAEVDEIAFYEKPFRKFERIIKDSIIYAPKGYMRFLKAVPLWLKERLNMRSTIMHELKRFESKFSGNIKFVDHHLAHAANAYYLSSFDKCAILVLDAVGEESTTSIYKAERGQITLLQQQLYPHSVGLLYSAFTYFLGFYVNSDEYKVMGLAPYGDADDPETRSFVEKITTKLVTINDNGSIKLNTSYFTFMYEDQMVDDSKWEKLFGIQKRDQKAEITQSHKNLAFAIQSVTESIFKYLAKTAMQIAGSDNLCISGGCALNCAANGALLNAGIANAIYVPYAPDDSGCSIGAALGCSLIGQKIKSQPSDISFIGPECDNHEIEESISRHGLNCERCDCNSLYRRVSVLLNEGKVVGWFQGRMEFGPRALGNRSILADPRNLSMKNQVNSKIKFREEFRPFAPVVLAEQADELMDTHGNSSEHMMFTHQMKRNGYDAVTHRDMSVRAQILHREYNEKLYSLIDEFFKLTGCPMLLNTSFNVMGEPIVCSPEDAIKTFLNSGLDVLILGNNLILK